MKGSTNATRGSADVVQNTSGVSVLDVALQNSTDSQPGLMSAADHSTLTTLKTTVAGKQDKLTFDSTPTENSTNPVTSGGVFSAINNKSASAVGPLSKISCSYSSRTVTVTCYPNSNYPSRGTKTANISYVVSTFFGSAVQVTSKSNSTTSSFNLSQSSFTYSVDTPSYSGSSGNVVAAFFTIVIDGWSYSTGGTWDW